ncbi:MBL fold metallo-hydrolase [Lederbergia sp. NSJ-179]|uniref:MBL fold metallo-hydrolase n=1 Tax=Lederbergia sp. NSJ-179 TaxID=2931402 RepID=UPI001FD290D7|nr:MBL fold metallo-hydrolase [Lederbergia sp. NSJ-179]MCJ7842734.1 MBL fold metallo-hydrolase [Lederbergia sp. NSJ-179]
MKIHFLGTAAAEGWPGMFCRCEFCQKAKELGGKNIRTRSSAIIDNILKIDFPPDTYHHVLRDKIDLAAIEYLFITHTHSDHFLPTDIQNRSPVMAHGVDRPLHIYGHDLVIQGCKASINYRQELYELHHIQPFRCVQVDERTKVTPLIADHDKHETCLLYFIEKDDKAILYGHDTGWFPFETWEWLEGKSFDLAILDCTGGPLPGRRNHMNNEAVIEMNDIFRQKAMLREGGIVIATHFSHNGGMLHEELERFFSRYDILVAYDGMVYHV